MHRAHFGIVRGHDRSNTAAQRVDLSVLCDSGFSPSYRARMQGVYHFALVAIEETFRQLMDDGILGRKVVSLFLCELKMRVRVRAPGRDA
jgi:hypothetical protein